MSVEVFEMFVKLQMGGNQIAQDYYPDVYAAGHFFESLNTEFPSHC